jgi:excisionase family DNA binding protein
MSGRRLAALPPLESPGERLEHALDRVRRAVIEIQTASTEVHAALHDMSRQASRQPQRASERSAFRVSEVAKRLGVHPNHVRNLIDQGKLEAIHSGTVVLIRAEELDRYLNSQGYN